MAGMSGSGGGNDDTFSFGLRELQQAEQASTPAPTPATRVEGPVGENRGFDPYNSGSFDRRKNWTSVRKR